MSSVRNLRAMTPGFIVAVLAAGIATASLAAGADPNPATSPSSTGAQAAATGALAPAVPLVGETRDNLQTAFASEMNAKQRYETFANRADREGYAAVAQLFRACAQAEQVHADRHVHAIAWTGGQARAYLDRVTVGGTAANLEAALRSETYEAEQFYPALLARARADREPEAVRSLNFALATEREHVALLTAALASLERYPPAQALYVCSYCGKTVESLDFKKCPNCFTSSRRFIRVGEAEPRLAGPERVRATSPEVGAAPAGRARDRAPAAAPPQPRK